MLFRDRDGFSPPWHAGGCGSEAVQCAHKPAHYLVRLHRAKLKPLVHCIRRPSTPLSTIKQHSSPTAARNTTVRGGAARGAGATMVVLTEQIIKGKTRLERLDDVRSLNLWGQDLDNVEVLQRMTNVEVLSLSVNRISSLRDFRNCSRLQVGGWAPPGQRGAAWGAPSSGANVQVHAPARPSASGPGRAACAGVDGTTRPHVRGRHRQQSAVVHDGATWCGVAWSGVRLDRPLCSTLACTCTCHTMHVAKCRRRQRG